MIYEEAEKVGLLNYLHSMVTADEDKVELTRDDKLYLCEIIEEDIDNG